MIIPTNSVKHRRSYFNSNGDKRVKNGIWLLLYTCQRHARGIYLKFISNIY